MAKITKVYTPSDSVYVGRRHLPLVASEKLMMVMDLNSRGLAIDSAQIRGRELEEFARKFNLLTESERRQSLEIKRDDFLSVLNQCVPCVGCRKRVDRLFNQLTKFGHRTLDPLELRPTSTLGITEEKMKTPQALGTLLYRHHEVLNSLLDNKLRNKTRCVLHTMDSIRAKPFSETWREVWSVMKNICRNELTIIETKELHDVLENYLKKHKFCAGCRTKIERAYKILIGEVTTKEKGFAPQLYAHIRKCVPDQHIHVSTSKIEFLDALIKRAEPEVNGSYSKLRERHAKTLEIAQEEVLTCVGMIMYERLRRIYVSLREEERACQVLAAVGVHALCRSFDTFVEQKQGISNLELLYKEMSRAEKAKELKREQKKLKKKMKKNEKKNLHRIVEDNAADNDEDNDAGAESDDEEDDAEDVELSEANSKAEAEEEEATEEPEVLEPLEPPMPPATTTNDATQIKSTNPKSKRQSKKKKQKAAAKKAKKQAFKDSSMQQQRPTSDDEVDGASCISSSADAALADPALGNKCKDCLAPMPDCPCEHDVRDSGYGSDPTSNVHSRTASVVSTPEGSEVSCSDGLCNHDTSLTDEEQSAAEGAAQLDVNKRSNNDDHLLQLTERFTLLRLLDDLNCEIDDNGKNCYIPEEVVLAYQCHRDEVQRQREEYRSKLRKNFARLCRQRGVQTDIYGSNSHYTNRMGTATGH